MLEAVAILIGFLVMVLLAWDACNGFVLRWDIVAFISGVVIALAFFASPARAQHSAERKKAASGASPGQRRGGAVEMRQRATAPRGVNPQLLAGTARPGRDGGPEDCGRRLGSRWHQTIGSLPTQR